MSDMPEHVAVPIVWIGVEETPIEYINQFVSQVDGEGFIVTVGQLTPPVLMGTPDELREQAEAISHVSVRPVVRLGLTAGKMMELVAILQANIDQAERIRQARPQDPR